MITLLNLKNLDFSMKKVYSLAENLKKNPDRVVKAQELTMDDSRPYLGLKGRYGLFGSEEWWRNIENGKFPLEFVAGEVKRVYVAGQDRSELNNTVDIVCADESEMAVGIYLNNPSDIELFSEGKWVELVYALDERKKQPARDGSVNVARLALEMVVSV